MATKTVKKSGAGVKRSGGTKAAASRGKSTGGARASTGRGGTKKAR